MKTINLLFTLLLAGTSFIFGQTTRVLENELFNGPEGIIYDPELKIYFAGNAGDGIVMTIDTLDNVSVLNESIGAGMIMSFEILGDSLFATTNYPTSFVCMDKNTGDVIYQIDMSEEAGSFSQMVTDPRTDEIYIADQTGAIFKANPHNETCQMFADSGIYQGAQALEIDTIQNRLLLFRWNNVAVKYINLYDSTDITTGPGTGVSKYSSSVMTQDGYIYASSWSGNRIRRMHIDSLEEATTYCNDSLDGPVGITHNPCNDIIAVCNYGNNTITFIEPVHDTTSGIADYMIIPESLNVFYNNNTSEITVFTNSKIQQVLNISVYDMFGGFVITGKNPSFTSKNEIKIKVEELKTGMYILSLTETNGIKGIGKFMVVD